MAKYFYTDPLKAAWMNKKFAMRFMLKTAAGMMELVRGVTSVSLKSTDKWYIHPDSLHILEPKVGDIGITKSGIPAMYDTFNNGSGFCTDEGLELDDCKIIQRDGKAFFMPEVKDDQDD